MKGLMKTLDKQTVSIGRIEKVALLSSTHHFSHWGWWVLWLFLFWPAWFILGYIGVTRKKHHVLLHMRGGYTKVNTYISEDQKGIIDTTIAAKEGKETMVKVKSLSWETTTEGYRTNALGYKFLVRPDHAGGHALCVFHGQGNIFPINKQEKLTVADCKKLAQDYLEAAVATWVIKEDEK